MAHKAKCVYVCVSYVRRPKAQADLMESMMGALCQAQIEHQPCTKPLARGLDAAFAFFRTFVYARPAQPQSDEQMGSIGGFDKAADMLRKTMPVHRSEPRQHVDEMRAAISTAFLPDNGFVRRPELLPECCLWSDDKIDGKAFQRLELLGDAFLQCTHRITRGHITPHPNR